MLNLTNFLSLLLLDCVQLISHAKLYCFCQLRWCFFAAGQIAQVAWPVLFNWAGQICAIGAAIKRYSQKYTQILSYIYDPYAVYVNSKGLYEKMTS